MERAKKILREYTKTGQRVAVAVSGGMDSMVLLHLASAMKIELKIELFVVSINHNLREKNGARDLEFVRGFCIENALSFEGFSVDTKKLMLSEGLGGELAARKLRFEVFADLRKTGVADLCLLAHHRSDQAETVLANILRGAGISGAKGMEILRDNYYLRPLLFTDKNAVCDYQKKHSVPFVIDETNAQNDYSRNLLRNRVFPILGERWAAEKQLAAFAERAAEDDGFIESLTGEPVKVGDEIALCSDELKKHPALASRYVRRGLRILGGLNDASSADIERVLTLCESQCGRIATLGGGLIATRTYDGVRLGYAKTKSHDNTRLAFEGAGEYSMGGNTIRVTLKQRDESHTAEFFAAEKKRGVLYFDADKLPQYCVLRFRYEGDIVKPFGGGRRKLKEFLIDKKIPQSLRDKIPLLVSQNNEILALAGHEISRDIKIDAQTKQLYRME